VLSFFLFVKQKQKWMSWLAGQGESHHQLSSEKYRSIAEFATVLVQQSWGLDHNKNSCYGKSQVLFLNIFGASVTKQE
jgi:hypothetical protein